MDHGHKRANRFAVIRIVGIYALFAAVWIYFSDTALGLLIQDHAILVRISVLKGFLFIIVTGALLYRLISLDIARRQQVEKELRASEIRFRSLFENMLNGFAYCKMLFDDDGRPVDYIYLDMNDAAEKMLGLQNIIGKKISEVIPGIRELHPGLLETYARVALTGKPETLEFEFKPLKIWLSHSVYSTEQGYFIIVFDNITERKRVEESLQKSLSILRQLTDNIQEVFWMASLDFSEMVYVSSAYEKIWGRTCESLYKEPKSFLDAIHPDDREKAVASFKQGGEQDVFEIEYRIARPDGSVRWIRDRRFRVKNGVGHLDRFAGLAEDITERRLMEHALQVSEQRLKLAAAAGHLGVWDLDIETGTLVWDDRMYEMYGIAKESFPGTIAAWEKCLHPGDREQATKVGKSAGRGEQDYDTEFRIQHPNGSVKYIKAYGLAIQDAHGKPIRVIGINQDITEQKTFAEKLRQAQKMELVGRLAGGVAHDFNNILTAIIGYGNLINLKMPATNPVHHYVDQIILSSEKAADLTRGLLAFSRQQVINPMPVDINRIVTNMQEILERVIGEDVDFKVMTAEQDLIVLVDKNQIEHVLMNLATNARDAMPQGGTLTIATEEGKIDTWFIQMHQYGVVGRYAVISVTDNGTGMDEKTAQHIFEPFFTTKEIGKGTGLGLSIAYGTIKQHNGFINVYSEPGMGTSFRIYLPLVQNAQPHTHEEPTAAVSRGTETLLLAEDDVSVRTITKTMLEELGYSIIEAVDGQQAIELFRKNKDRVRLVVSDMIMPGLGGKDIHQELKKIKPDVKILYMSGYATDIHALQGSEKEKINFISKPFGPDGISKKIREILDGHKQ